MCGEHPMRLSPPFANVGSSPRVRGTLTDGDAVELGGGIIPACAGNTLRPARLHADQRDHPRVCGEHSSTQSFCCPIWGSSPRVRGTLRTPANASSGAGIIPACAGNTAFSCTSHMMPRDHPRVCGEHRKIICKIGVCSGSSPRVRGTL